MARFVIDEVPIESARIEVRTKGGRVFTVQIVDSEAFPASGAVDAQIEPVEVTWPAFGEVGRTTVALRLSGWAEVHQMELTSLCGGDQVLLGLLWLAPLPLSLRPDAALERAAGRKRAERGGFFEGRTYDKPDALESEITE